MEYFQFSQEEALEALEVDPRRGLSRGEVQRRRAKYGKNQLETAKRRGVLRQFLGQFQDLMVLILLAAAAVSFGVSWVRGDGEYVDSLIILAIVVVNAVIGTVQERRADKAIEALKKLSSPHAQVLREGKRQRVESWELVPGDIVILQAGDLVPADLRLLRSVELKTEESALTGESLPAEKDAQAHCPQNAPLGERKNMVFASTGVASGAGVGVAVATGMDTAMGKIARMLQNEKAPQTPLQQKLKQTGKVLGVGVVLICGVIFLLGLFQRMEPLEMFMIAISLGVAAIPEGLTAVVTIVLAMGIKRMAQKRAIVRHLPAVETLGSTQVICSDKTGTLTQNKMTVVAFAGPQGEQPLESPAAQFALELATLCNNSQSDWGHPHRRPHRDSVPPGLQAGETQPGAGLPPHRGDTLHLRPEDDDHRPPPAPGRLPRRLQGRAGCAHRPVYGAAAPGGAPALHRRHEGEAPLRQRRPSRPGPAGAGRGL